MERTPSPPRRVRARTPPAPLLGPKYDSYEPYSPRRSSRVAAQSHLHLEQTSPTRLRRARDVTPTSSGPRRKPAPPASTHTLSPPASPISPPKFRSPRSTRRAQQPPSSNALESDSDHAAPTPATRRFLNSMAAQESLLTPAKTPRKRALKTQESLRPTARVLFAANRPATIDEAMPAPRKGRKTVDAITLESFAQQMEDGNEKIEIYTDSKERVPTRDDEEDNPFVIKKGKGKAKAAPPKPRPMDAHTKELFDAAARGEGMVFSIKGKKIFRKFHDGPPSDASDGEKQAYEEGLLRESSSTTYGRITRSSIKPRLLFKEEIARIKKENGEEDEEEAVTDIDQPVATPSRKSAKASASTSQEATPPPTKRVKKTQMSFDSWSRVKSSSRSDSASRESRKRSGPPLERGADKRARSSEHSTSSMSIDRF
ncbi:hypothetical protein P280DRAFT_514325 [Massarina eburnea CBS 473.64]|uniref:Uncharacterized protein n=1 Tax=Massarina eburnea CBS 473.64 TaxID=1395130 RepID=A0A6A6SAQ0_9PLEO|nr:hypothetical protein P280DRAFT_514325 [Massarina eburnea CBS 473.64]